MRVHFHVTNDEFVPDSVGQIVADRRSVLHEARILAVELLSDGYKQGEDRRGWRIQAEDETGAAIIDADLVGTLSLCEGAV